MRIAECPDFECHLPQSAFILSVGYVDGHRCNATSQVCVFGVFCNSHDLNLAVCAGLPKVEALTNGVLVPKIVTGHGLIYYGYPLAVFIVVIAETSSGNDRNAHRIEKVISYSLYIGVWDFTLRREPSDCDFI